MTVTASTGDEGKVASLVQSDDGGYDLTILAVPTPEVNRSTPAANGVRPRRFCRYWGSRKPGPKIPTVPSAVITLPMA